MLRDWEGVAGERGGLTIFQDALRALSGNLDLMLAASSTVRIP